MLVSSARGWPSTGPRRARLHAPALVARPDRGGARLTRTRLTRTRLTSATRLAAPPDRGHRMLPHFPASARSRFSHESAPSSAPALAGGFVVPLNQGS